LAEEDLRSFWFAGVLVWKLDLLLVLDDRASTWPSLPDLGDQVGLRYDGRVLLHHVLPVPEDGDLGLLADLEGSRLLVVDVTAMVRQYV